MNKFKNLNKGFDLIIKFIFLIIIGFIIYTFYRSEILYDGQYREYYLKYYIFLISSFFILLLLNLLRREIKLIIYLILISFFVGLYISEALFINFQKITRYEFYKNYKKKNDVVVAIQPAQYILKDINKKKIFPLSGISKKETILCQKPEDKEFLIYESDRYGFRNIDSNWDKKEINFILLGDSFVKGHCVDSSNIISTLFSKIYKDTFNEKITTINLAYGGNGPLIEYATLKEYLKYMKVKKVIYFFYEGNDLVNLSLELKDPFLIKYLDDNFKQGLIDRQIDVDKVNLKLLEQEINKKKKENLYKFIKLGNVRKKLNYFFNLKFKEHITEPDEEIYNAYNNILFNLKKLTESQNIELNFVYLPYIGTFLDSDYYQTDKIHKKIISMVKAHDIQYIDLLNILRSKEEDPLSMYDSRKNQHLNEKGYKFVAETLIKNLNKIEK